MSLNTIIQELRNDLDLYKKTETYQINDYSKDIVSGIEKAISLIETAVKKQDKIQEVNKHYFKGAYQVAREFEEKEWRRIGFLYDEMVKIAEANYW